MVSKQFQTFCTSKAEIVYGSCLRQRQLSGGGKRRPPRVYSRTKAVGDRTDAWPSPSLPLRLAPRIPRPTIQLQRGDLKVCAQPPQGARSRDKCVGCSPGSHVWLHWREQVASMSMGTEPTRPVTRHFLNLAGPSGVFSLGREAGFKVSSFTKRSPNQHP